MGLAGEDAVEAGVGSAGVPVVEWAVVLVVEDPELAGGGFPGSWEEVFDGGLVDFDVGAGAHVGGDEVVEGLEGFGEVVVPVAHHVAVDFDAVGGAQLPFLALEGLVVAELFGE